MKSLSFVFGQYLGWQANISKENTPKIQMSQEKIYDNIWV